MNWINRFRRKPQGEPIKFSDLEDVATIYVAGHVWVKVATLQEHILPYLMEAAEENPEVPGQVLIQAIINTLEEVDNETMNSVFDAQFGVDNK